LLWRAWSRSRCGRDSREREVFPAYLAAPQPQIDFQSSEQNAKCIRHGRDKAGHDEFSCEITDAENADDKITHRIASALSALETLAQERRTGTTTDNLASANNFIRAGYRLYQPQTPWAWPNTVYWRKSIM
jgi:hypothetical protein